MLQEIQIRVARALVEIKAVGFVPDTPIRFKSGILSPIYIDNRCLPFYPDAWHTVINGFQELIEHTQINYDVIAGMAVGGVPHGSALAYAMNQPSVFVRKEAKEHGTQKLVEGGDVTGKHVLLVEDLVTTGGSSLAGVAALRNEGAVVTHVGAIVSYQFGEATSAFEAAGLQLHTLTNFQTILQEAVNTGVLNENAVTTITDWFENPHVWTGRHERK